MDKSIGKSVKNIRTKVAKTNEKGRQCKHFLKCCSCEQSANAVQHQQQQLQQHQQQQRQSLKLQQKTERIGRRRRNNSQ